MAPLLLVFAVAAGVTAMVSPLCRKAAIALGMVTRPDESKPDQRPLPLMGGVAMFLGLASGIAVAARLEPFRDAVSGSRELAGVVAAAAVTLVVGVVDDDRELRPRAKMAGQIVGIIPLLVAGVSLLYVQLPAIGLVSFGPVLAPVATVVWVLAVATAINFIDGLDGLAAGVVAISSLAIALFAFRLDDLGLLAGGEQAVSPLLAVLTAGVCVGFLTSNFHPARLIMGDAGALMLGVLVASTTGLLGAQTIELPRSTIYFVLSPLLVPVVILGVPVLNTGLAVIRRTRRGLSPAADDKEHLHDRLMQLGHGHRRSVLILWSWTAILSVLALVPAYTDQSEALAPVVLVAGVVAFFTVLRPIRIERRRRRLEQAGTAPVPST